MKRLWITFRYTFTGLRGQILGWGLGLGLYGMMIIPMYETFAGKQDTFQKMIASYPPEFLAFFGATVNSMLTPDGFLGMYAFSMMPVIIGIFAVLAGSGLIVSDEERGRLDLIIAHPVGRLAFFFGRVLGILAAVFSIHILGWLGFSILLGSSSLGVNWIQMAAPFLPLLIQVIFFIALGLLLSMFLPSRNLAAMVTGAFMVTSYFVSSMAFMNERLADFSKLMPYHYFQTILSVQELNFKWLLALLGLSVFMILGAWLRFDRRDIRLSGEGSWQLPFRPKQHKNIQNMTPDTGSQTR